MGKVIILKKKAEMGIGTLIIFISLLLVAAVAAGVLIQTTGSLQSKALTTGDEAKSKISTSVYVVEVSGSDGTNGSIRTLYELVKLNPGSDGIKMSQTMLSISTQSSSASLKFAGTGATLKNEAEGYYTFTAETSTGSAGTYSKLKNDYDEDGVNDTLYNGTSGNPVYLNLSSTSDLILANCSGSTFNSMLTANNYVKSVSGTCSGTNISTITLVPKKEGRGVFSIEYITKGKNWKDGNLNYGDAIRIYLEAPGDIGEDEVVRLNFIPKIGSSTQTKFITPNIISTERVYLYP